MRKTRILSAFLGCLFLLLLTGARFSSSSCSGLSGPVSGDVCYDTTVQTWLQYNGTAWQGLNQPEYATASLPATCTQYEQAVLTDGDAAGAVVQCDAANKWHCLNYYESGIFQITCPPWNASVNNTAAQNVTALNALATDYITQTDLFNNNSTGDSGGCVYTPNGTFLLDGTVTFSDDDGSQRFCFLGQEGGVSRWQWSFASTTAGTAGLVIQTTVGGQIGNLLRISKMHFRGDPAVGPDHMTYLRNMYQVKMDQTWVTDYKKIGLNVNAAGNAEFMNGLCGTDTSADSLATCFYVNAGGNIIIKGWNGEGSIAGGDTAADVDDVFITATGALNRLQVLGNNLLSPIGYFITTNGNATRDFNEWTIADNMARVNVAGIMLADNSDKEAMSFDNNTFKLDSGITPASGNDCMNLHGLLGSTVSNNKCWGFYTAIRSLNNDDTTFRDNIGRDITQDGFWDFKNDIRNHWINNSLVGTEPAGHAVSIADGTATGGNNVIELPKLGYTLTSGRLLDKTNVAASDLFTFPRGYGAVTCSSDPTAYEPYTSTLWITETAVGDCTVNLDTTEAAKGQEVLAILVSTDGGTIDVDGVTITTTTPVRMFFDGSAWVPLQ